MSSTSCWKTTQHKSQTTNGIPTPAVPVGTLLSEQKQDFTSPLCKYQGLEKFQVSNDLCCLSSVYSTLNPTTLERAPTVFRTPFSFFRFLVVLLFLLALREYQRWRRWIRKRWKSVRGSYDSSFLSWRVENGPHTCYVSIERCPSIFLALLKEYIGCLIYIDRVTYIYIYIHDT